MLPQFLYLDFMGPTSKQNQGILGTQGAQSITRSGKVCAPIIPRRIKDRAKRSSLLKLHPFDTPENVIIIIIIIIISYAHQHKACRREKLSNLTAATMSHSVTIVFWKATAFPCWRAMDSR